MPDPTEPATDPFLDAVQLAYDEDDRTRYERWSTPQVVRTRDFGPDEDPFADPEVARLKTALSPAELERIRREDPDRLALSVDLRGDNRRKDVVPGTTTARFIKHEKATGKPYSYEDAAAWSRRFAETMAEDPATSDEEIAKALTWGETQARINKVRERISSRTDADTYEDMGFGWKAAIHLVQGSQALIEGAGARGLERAIVGEDTMKGAAEVDALGTAGNPTLSAGVKAAGGLAGYAMNPVLRGATKIAGPSLGFGITEAVNQGIAEATGDVPEGAPGTPLDRLIAAGGSGALTGRALSFAKGGLDRMAKAFGGGRIGAAVKSAGEAAVLSATPHFTPDEIGVGIADPGATGVSMLVFALFGGARGRSLSDNMRRELVRAGLTEAEVAEIAPKIQTEAARVADTTGRLSDALAATGASPAEVLDFIQGKGVPADERLANAMYVAAEPVIAEARGKPPAPQEAPKEAPVEAPVAPVAEAGPVAPTLAEAPVQPAVEAPPKIAPRETHGGGKPRSADAIAREATGKSLSQFVREQGGINEGSAGLGAEVERLGRKGSATTGLVRRDGGGLDAERMLQSAKESGYPVEGMSPAEFIEAVEMDATRRERTVSPETTDFEGLAEADFRRRAQEEAKHDEAEPPPDAKPGDLVSGRTREGVDVTGTVERVTERGLILHTGERIPKKSASVLFDEGGEPLGDVGNARLPLTIGAPKPEHAGGKPMGPQEVIAALADVVDAPIRSGRMASGKQTRGHYDPEQGVIRIRESNNIPTATHEVGHAISAETGARAGLKDKAVRKELIHLGKLLYGNRRPAAGYAEEGVGELVRLYVTNPAEFATAAPKAAAWFDAFLKTAEGVDYAAPLAKARAASSQYAGQGSQARAQGGMVLGRAGPGPLRRLKEFFSVKNQMEEFAPLKTFTDEVARIEGAKPAFRDDPYEVASAARMTGPAKVRDWIEGQGVTDVAGNVIGTNLDVALAPAAKVDPGLKGFRAYLWARHALDVHAAGMNPGMAEADAKHIVESAGHEFQIAAENFYEWRRNVLRSGESSGLFTAEQVAKWIGRWPHSVPLNRVFDEPTSIFSRRREGAGTNPIMRLKGSGKRIRDPLATSIEQAVRIQRAADRYRVLRAIATHATGEGGAEGIGRVIEEVPKDKVPHTMTVEAIRDQLKEAGADLTDADLEATITHWAAADRPKGTDPIFSIRKANGESTWYHVEPGMWEALEGLDVYVLPKFLDLTLGTLKRSLVLGTTGLRPAFGVVRNPARDLPTFLMQSSGGVREAGAAYAAAVAEVAKGVTGKGDAPYYDLFKRLGVSMAQPLGADTRPVRRAVKGLGKGRTWKTAHSPVEALRDMIQFSEMVPRIAELKIVADRLGWDGKRPLTENEMIEMTLAARRITTDFGAGGKFGKVINAISAFYNPAIQGARTMVRAFKANPKAAVLRGLVGITGPTLALWWLNKDEDWYKQLTPAEKFTYWHFAGEREDVRIPRPYEWGNLFSVLPEAIVDAAYQKDPKGVGEALKVIFENTAPDPLNNPAFKVPMEQARNRVGFTKAPIVPRSEEDVPIEEQAGPETTGVAKLAGRLFGLSPRRVDHAIRGVFGGVGADVAGLTGRGRPDREGEPADIPVFGTLFKRVGKDAGPFRSVEAVYEKADAAIRRSNSKERAETPVEEEDRKRLTNATEVLGMLSKARTAAKTQEAQRRYSVMLRTIAATVDKGGVAPEAKEIREVLEQLGLVKPRK